METTKEFKGIWWLPEVIENQVYGTLIVKKDKIVLEAVEVFGPDSPNI